MRPLGDPALDPRQAIILENVPSIVLAHHEKLDGSGYPQGLGAEEIPVRARLLTVCDIFDAVTALDRPYRSALPIEGGLDLLREDANAGKIDRDLVELFVEARVWERRLETPKLIDLLSDP